MQITQRIADELGVRVAQIESTVALLDEGATVPFIARYRKEVTGGLDDTQLRTLEERLLYLRELEERRAVILDSIGTQGKLTPGLQQQLQTADTKARLEDLYAPYKPKRRTKAQIAREAGIEPLLDTLLQDPTLDPLLQAQQYLNSGAGFADGAAVLDGARQIFMERAAEQADLVGRLREHVWQHGGLRARVVAGKEQEGSKFADYFTFDERLRSIPSHRALALFRGRSEGVLTLKLCVPEQDDEALGQPPGVCERMIAGHFTLHHQGRAADRWLMESVRWAWRIKLVMQLETEANLRLREFAEDEAIRVFGENLRDLLLAAPAGLRPTMGLDPGLRTGVKIAVVDATGKLVDHAVMYPHAPRNDWEGSLRILAALARKHQVELISIGNGTASRETDKLARELIKRMPELRLSSVVVSEAGASVYSASALAAREFPDLDVTVRGAVSIARRLQDPLAELVKIEPKAIGVGQYQHDVNQGRLARKLEAVIEDCVNAVGVMINSASAPLLARVAGLTPTLAENIVAYREQHGVFHNRQQLLQVSRLGPKVFEQATGFLRISGGDNPLDASAVHPESYPLVERMLAAVQRRLHEVIGDQKFIRSLRPADFADERFGEPTVRDIFRELEKPGRDPRPEFKTASFQDGVEALKDLQPGMILEGVVSNVTNFGAFVDIGVHQDGLVHISALSEKYVSDPRQVVKAGDVIKVKVMSVDLARRRIGLSMRMTDEPGQQDVAAPSSAKQLSNPAKARPVRPAAAPAPQTAMASAFEKLKR
ncbi:MAG: RNA-binding transcriptional accessory protein [Gammaproteobacteria bacterium]|nr:RNA-binding transcriptional accessory protein [Gammaproteobacteria bacterium]